MLREAKMCFEELFESGYVYRYGKEAANYMKKQGQPFKSFQRKVGKNGHYFIEELMQPIVSPVVINLEERKYLEKLAKAWPVFMRAQLEIYKLARKNRLKPKKLNQIIRLCCTEKEWQNGLIDPDFPFIHPFIRLDAIRSEEGLKIVDINSTRPAGAGDIILAQKVMQQYFEEDLEKMPLAENFVKAVLESLQSWENQFNGKIREKAIFCRETEGDWHNFQILKKVLTENNLNFKMITTGDEFQKKKKSLDLVIRSRIKEGDELFSLLEEDYPKGRCIISPIFRRFLGNKIWMFLIKSSELKDFFKSKMGKHYKIIADCFAPVGLVNKGRHLITSKGTLGPIENLSRKDWVFKQPASSSGKQMLLGLFMGQKKWQNLLKKVKPGWIAQRVYMHPEEVMFLNKTGESLEKKMHVKYGIFILGGRFAGMEVMHRRTPLVHGARDTYISPVFFKPSVS